MSELNAVVAVYGTHIEAEEAVKALQGGGIELRTLSIAGNDSHTDEQAVGCYNIGDRTKYWGKTVGFWDGFRGLLFGSAFFVVPGIGPVLVAGPVVAWIVAALEGGAVIRGVSVIGAGLFGMGIPKDNIIQYETALKMDQLLLMVDGAATEVERARAIMAGTRSLNVTQHSVALHSPEVAETAAR